MKRRLSYSSVAATLALAAPATVTFTCINFGPVADNLLSVWFTRATAVQATQVQATS